MRDFPDFVCMPAFSCSSIHFTHFAIYRIIFGVGNFWRGFFVCDERKCSIFVSVLFCFYLLRLYIKFATWEVCPGLFSLGAFPTFWSHDFRHGSLYVESSEGGRGGLYWSDSLPSSLENFWKFLVFFSFCRSVVGTSGLAPSATSGPLILQVLRKIGEWCSLISPNLNLQDHFLASI